MLVTLAVLKLERLSEVKDVHSSNINAMFATLAVLRLERSSEVKSSQYRNMEAVLVALERSKYSNPTIFKKYFSKTVIFFCFLMVA